MLDTLSDSMEEADGEERPEQGNKKGRTLRKPMAASLVPGKAAMEEAGEERPEPKGKKGKMSRRPVASSPSKGIRAASNEGLGSDKATTASDSEEEETMQLTNADMADPCEDSGQHVPPPEQPLSESAGKQARGSVEVESTTKKRTNGSSSGKKKGGMAKVAGSTVNTRNKRKPRGQGQKK